MEIEVSSAWKSLLSSSVKEGQRCVGEKIRKGEKISSTKRDKVRPLSNWRFSLISWGSIVSENFSCSISIANLE